LNRLRFTALLLPPSASTRRATHRRPTAWKPRRTQYRPSSGTPRARTTALGNLNTQTQSRPSADIPRATHYRPTACIPRATQSRPLAHHSPSNALQAYGLNIPSDAVGRPRIAGLRPVNPERRNPGLRPALPEQRIAGQRPAYPERSPPSSGSSACSCYKFGRTSHCRVEV
jgi:hypothetical protein